MVTTFLLFLLLTGIFLLFGYILGRKKGMVIAFLIACAMNFYSYYYSADIVIRSYRAMPVPENHRLYRITKKVAQSIGMPMPEVYITPHRSPNAFATGRSPDDAAVCATKGILKLLNDDELEAVIGHELGHIANRDVLISTVAATMTGALILLARFGYFLFSSGDDAALKFVAVVAAPIAATIVSLAISRQREYEADAFGARKTGKPLALAQALWKISGKAQQIPLKGATPETAHLFFVHPFRGRAFFHLFSTHPPVEERVKRLIAMQKQLSP